MVKKFENKVGAQKLSEILEVQEYFGAPLKNIFDAALKNETREKVKNQYKKLGKFDF